MGNFYLQGETCLRIMPTEKEDQGNGGILSTCTKWIYTEAPLGFALKRIRLGLQTLANEKLVKLH